MTALTNAQKTEIIEKAIRTVKAGGHSSVSDVVGEVWEDCKKLGLSELDVLNFLFCEPKFMQIKVSV